MSRPNWGKYGRKEVGVIGAPCGVIEKWVYEVLHPLQEKYKIAYLDADHNESQKPSIGRITDKISHHQITYDGLLNEYDQKILLSQLDLVVVNSNHFSSAQQIVFCTDKKKESLHRKLDRLTNVIMVVLDDGIEVPFDFLETVITQDTPICSISNISKASNLLERLLSSVPEVNGLILAGGQSSRMGQNKADLRYHGVSQVEYLSKVLANSGIQPYVSCRLEQEKEYSNSAIVDQFVGLGPFGAILSAFRSFPDAAWLVTACDIPLLTDVHFKMLMDQRDPSKVATCFYNPETQFPEPLITLWEPKAYGRLLNFMALGYNCPRKVLINSDVKVIQIDDVSFMANANTPEERKRIEEQLGAS